MCDFRGEPNHCRVRTPVVSKEGAIIDNAHRATAGAISPGFNIHRNESTADSSRCKVACRHQHRARSEEFELKECHTVPPTATSFSKGGV